MVVFTCTHCGESLQKPRVEKHYQTTCKNHPISVSCMDCFKDFKMQEYAAHVKCVSEEERYAAKGAVMNPKKGEMKQSSWIETVNAIIAKEKNAKPEVRKLLETISKHSNVPRKKNKFLNFINSTTGGSAKPDDVEAVWNLLESHKPAAPAPAAQEKSKEGKLEHVKSNKKRKSEMIADDNAESATPQKKKKANKPKEEGEMSEAAAPATTGADTEQKPSKKKKAEKKPDEKAAPESDGAAAADKNKNAKRKKRKSGDADGEAPATSEPVPSAPVAPTATNNAASTQNGDVPKKKKKTTTPAPTAETPAESAKKESPKKKKSQPAANNTAPADAPAAGNAEVAPKKSKKKAASGDDKTETNVTEDKAPKKKEKKTKSLANGEAATDKKSAADGDKKKEKKAKETNDKPVKSNWEESVRTIIKSKPSGMTKDELIEQLVQRQAAAGEEIQSKAKLRKHIIKLLYKMPGVKVDKDCITPAN